MDDVPLNEQGLLDAEHLKQQLCSFDSLSVYSSPFARAKETAEILSSEYTVVEELHERNYGNWKGKNKIEIRNETPVKYFLGKFFPGFISPLGGSLFEVYNRREHLLDIIWNDIENYSVMVTHGSIIHSLMMYPKKIVFRDYWKFAEINQIKCGDIYSLRIQKL